MLAIVNVSSPETPQVGPNTYEVRVNRDVIATFTHIRVPNGAAQCLRDAADAIDNAKKSRNAALIDGLQGQMCLWAYNGK